MRFNDNELTLPKMGREGSKTNLSNLVINKKSKGNLFAEKPVFCSNGNSLVVASGQSCYLYNTSTGNCVKELFQCTDNVICCQIHPFQTSQLIVVTENGDVSVFNLTSNEIDCSFKLLLNPGVLKCLKLPSFNNQNKLDENFDWESQQLVSLKDRKFLYAEAKPFTTAEIFVWATWCLPNEVLSHISVFSFNSGKLIKQINFRTNGLQKCYLNFSLNKVQDADFFVGMGLDSVHIAKFEKQSKFHHKFRKHFISQDVKVTCLTFHPVECCFATGDSLGRIIVWRNILDKNPLKDIFHWHTKPVHDVIFSKFGNYMFSGGEENVLVKWSLTSRNRDFLPRLSSAIHRLSIAQDASLLSISTIDNKILIINFNFENVSTIQHFSRWSALKCENKHSIFAIDPRNNCFVLNGKTGHIQFLSIKEDGKFMYTFDVTNRNFITSDSNTVIENTEVTHAKFTGCGTWLITAESRHKGLCKESRLKFWKYHETERSFTLNTNVEFPHGDIGIYSLEVGSNEKVATTGADKKFRLWTTFESQQGSNIREIWSVQSVNEHRNFPCFAVDFSKDATLIAVTFGPVLTIWENGDTCILKCALSVPYRKDDLKFCKFGNNELSHLVVTGSESNVSAWNTITLSMIWTVPLRLSILISDPFSIYMVAFSSENTLIIFNPASPSPDLLLKNVADFPVTAAHCVVSETGKFCMYFLTANQDLYCLEDGGKANATVIDHKSKTFLTPFSAQLAKIRNDAKTGESERIAISKNNRKLVSSLLEAPAHTLPNPSQLCADVLKALLTFSDNPVAESGEVSKKELLEVRQVAEITSNEFSRTEAELMKFVKTIFV